MYMATGITIAALLIFLVVMAGVIFLMGFGLWKMSRNAGIPHAWTSFIYPLYNMGLLAERSLYTHTGNTRPLARWSLWLLAAIVVFALISTVGTALAIAIGSVALSLTTTLLSIPLAIAGVVLSYYTVYYILKDYAPGNEVILLIISIIFGAYPIIFLVVMNVVPVSVAGRLPYGQPRYNRPGCQDPGQNAPPCNGPQGS